MGIDTGHQPLGGRFFIAGRSIDLPGEIQVSDQLRLQRRLELRGIEIVVFDGVCRTENADLLKPFDGPEGRKLRLQRQRRGKALQIILKGIPAFRLQKKLMRILSCKGPELIFYRRAIARADALDLAGKKRRPVESRPQDIVDTRIGMNQKATFLRPALLNGRRNRKKRKTGRALISFLTLEP